MLRLIRAPRVWLAAGLLLHGGANATTPGDPGCGPDALPTAALASPAAAQREELTAQTLTEQAYTLLEEMIVRLELAPGSEMIGWDLLSIGLPAAGMRFDHGVFDQSIALPGVWLERVRVDASDPRSVALLESPLGLDGMSAVATMWCASGSERSTMVLDALLDDARATLAGAPEVERAGATAPHPRLVVVRMLAERAEPLWQRLQAIRHLWRARLWNRGAVSPRVWST